MEQHPESYRRNYRPKKERNQRKREIHDNQNEKSNFQKHPAHLKGREIGMFYANKQRKLVVDPTRKIMLGTVVLPENKLTSINNRLEKYIPSNFITDNGVSYDYIKDSHFKKEFLNKISFYKNNESNKIKVVSDSYLDNKLKDEFLLKQKDPLYKRMLKDRMKLPAYTMAPEILNMIENNQIVIISGETGCGKTTQIVQFVLDDYIMSNKGSLCNIICSQPRRISAISVAERVAQERAENLGISAGYKIRLESCMPRNKGGIIYCTSGVILKLLESDNVLSNYSHVILDEIHERDITSDFLITLIPNIIKMRKDIRIILMSATLNSKQFADYFQVTSILEIPGFTFPVDEYFLEDILRLIPSFVFPMQVYSRKANRKSSWKNDAVYKELVEVIKYQEIHEPDKVMSRETLKADSEEINLDLIMLLIIHICEKMDDKGSILVFLTGYGEIDTLNTIMQKSNKFPTNKYTIIPLHSQMPTAEQKLIFNPSPLGKRKIILSTNIAETSITINDVTFVINCGKIKIKNYDASTDIHTLQPEWISQANASQRRGRAGRVKPGVCYHMYTRVRAKTLKAYLTPEILRERLDSVILDCKVLKMGDAGAFLGSFLDPPDANTISMALDALMSLNALDKNENLTPLGYHLAKLPISPNIGKMVLLGAIFSCLDPILSVGAALDYKDPFQLPLGDNALVDRMRLKLCDGVMSDHLVYHKVIHKFENARNQRQFCHEHFLNYNTMRQLVAMKSQFAKFLYGMKFIPSNDSYNKQSNYNSNNISLVKAIICAGLYPNIVVNLPNRRGRISKHSSFKIIPNIKKQDFKGNVKFHLKSVINHFDAVNECLFAYHIKIKSTADFIHDATMVYPLPVLLFGDTYSMNRKPHDAKGDGDENAECSSFQPDVDLDYLISFTHKYEYKSTEGTARLIFELRNRFNWFLQYKVSHPGFVNWGPREAAAYDPQIDTLRAIMELITFEEESKRELLNNA